MEKFQTELCIRYVHANFHVNFHANLNVIFLANSHANLSAIFHANSNSEVSLWDSMWNGGIQIYDHAL